MVVITFFLFFIPACAVAYWIGRGVRLNKNIQRAIANPKMLVDIHSGEILDPKSPEGKRARADKRVVRFDT